nr:hypothetical protein [Pseudomonas sp. CG7]
MGILFRSQTLAVLAVNDHHIIQALLDGNTSRHSGTISTFGDDPFGFWLQTGFIQQCFQGNARPLSATHQTTHFGCGFNPRRKKRYFSEAVDQQPMYRRIDLWYARVVALIKQTVWG